MADLIQWGISLKSEDAVRKLNDLQIKTQTTGKGFVTFGNLGTLSTRKVATAVTSLGADIVGLNGRVLQLGRAFGGWGIAAAASIGLVVAVWKQLKSEQEEARKSAEKYRDVLRSTGDTGTRLAIRQELALVNDELDELVQKQQQLFRIQNWSFFLLGSEKPFEALQRQIDATKLRAQELKLELAGVNKELTRKEIDRLFKDLPTEAKSSGGVLTKEGLREQQIIADRYKSIWEDLFDRTLAIQQRANAEGRLLTQSEQEEYNRLSALTAEAARRSREFRESLGDVRSQQISNNQSAIQGLKDEIALVIKYSDTKERAAERDIEIYNQRAFLTDAQREEYATLRRQQVEIEAADAKRMEQLQQIAQIYNETRTPLENYNIQVERLNELYATGGMDIETYRRAHKMLKDQLMESDTALQALNAEVDDFRSSLRNGLNEMMTQAQQNQQLITQAQQLYLQNKITWMEMAMVGGIVQHRMATAAEIAAQRTRDAWLQALQAIQTTMYQTFGDSDIGKILGFIAGAGQIYVNTKTAISSGKGQQ